MNLLLGFVLLDEFSRILNAMDCWPWLFHLRSLRIEAHSSIFLKYEGVNDDLFKLQNLESHVTTYEPSRLDHYEFRRR